LIYRCKNGDLWWIDPFSGRVVLIKRGGAK